MDTKPGSGSAGRGGEAGGSREPGKGLSLGRGWLPLGWGSGAMDETVRKLLRGALEELEAQELERFKAKLSENAVRRGYRNIPMKWVEGLDLSDLLIHFYGEDYALELTADVLEAVGRRGQAEKLREAAGLQRKSHWGRVFPAQHFIERHREELIQRTAMVEGVLDMLHGTVLDEEQYQQISSRKTNQEKMRELYKLVPSWDDFSKNLLYEALKTKNHFLIEDLVHEDITDLRRKEAHLVQHSRGTSDSITSDTESSKSGFLDMTAKPLAPDYPLKPSAGEDFVENHQEELIRRVFGMDLILRQLRGITREQEYEIKDAHQPMRKLYELMSGWRTGDKDQLQHILRATNRRLIEQLAGGHFLDRHKEDLIEEVTEVPLSDLHTFVLDEKEYQRLVNCATEKLKREVLFLMEQTWDRKKKDLLYRSLAESNRHVIERLEEEHFIEKHQEELTHRVSRVDSILWRLRIPTFQREDSNEKTMKKLYTLVPTWNRRQKDRLYTVLKKTHGPLIAELEEGHFVERHKKNLIENVTRVNRVATSLIERTIQYSLFADILKRDTDKEKMELLYEVVPGWNGDWKDLLYEALRTTNDLLIKELEERKCSKEGLIPDTLAKDKCYLCRNEQTCPEVQPEVVADANGEMKTYRIHLPKAGTFLCSVTELRFEVKAAVTVEYAFCSWDTHLSEAEKHQWMVAGPLFDIQADPAEEVAAVHLPHFVCLTEGKADISHLKIAHFVDGGMILEKPSRVSLFHAVLENPTFSPLGTVFNFIYSKFFPIHSVVLLYQAKKKITTLHLYLIPNDSSIIQAIKTEEERQKSSHVWKPPQTEGPLYVGTRYTVSSCPELMITPKELGFFYKSPGQLQSFVEVKLRYRNEVGLSVKKKEDLCLVWDTWLDPEDVLIQEEPCTSGATPEKAESALSSRPKTKLDHLTDILEDLKEEDLKRFKDKLHNFPVKEHFDNIPEGQLQHADPLDVKNLLFQYYSDYAIELTIEVLKAANFKQQADRLSKLAVPTFLRKDIEATDWS
ncbi:uncharacterized protein [Tiliqua scincoides]|uniref:uncharacterized protein isoform X2 n=1 Tax=Tiliqua scincoides TaxID=71010 RepID=UPI003461C555